MLKKLESENDKTIKGLANKCKILNRLIELNVNEILDIVDSINKDTEKMDLPESRISKEIKIEK